MTRAISTLNDMRILLRKVQWHLDRAGTIGNSNLAMMYAIHAELIRRELVNPGKPLLVPAVDDEFAPIAAITLDPEKDGWYWSFTDLHPQDRTLDGPWDSAWDAYCNALDYMST